MKKQINILFCALIAFSSCTTTSIKDEVVINTPTSPPPPLPLIPIDADIQINSIPHPFNLNGNMPYAVWVDGKRLALSMQETQSLAKSLNIKFTQPKDTAEIHMGNGWQRPLEIDPQKSDVQNFFKEEEVFIDVE
tara:strand:- start:694 stop:1098 length:405 start_codon:yes stop_codon:yes gene_type:complete